MHHGTGAHRSPQPPVPAARRETDRPLLRQAAEPRRLGERHQVVLPGHPRGLPVPHHRRRDARPCRTARDDRREVQERRGAR